MEDTDGAPEQPTDPALRDAMAAERAGAAHWRQVARDREAALQAVTRRPVVRAALALDRAAAPLRERVIRARRAVDRAVGRGRLQAGALRSRAELPARDRALRDAVSSLPTAAPDGREITVVVLDPGGGAPSRSPRARRRRQGEVDASPTGHDGRPPIDARRRAAVATVRADDAAAIRAAVDRSDGQLVCLLAATSEPLEPGWLDRLASAVTGPVVAAAPVSLHPRRPTADATAHDLRVRAEGIDVVRDDQGVPRPLARRAGAAADPSRPVAPVAASGGAALVVDRDAYLRAGGLQPFDDLDAAVIDLCTRIRSTGGRIAVVPEAMVVDHRPVAAPERLAVPIDVDGRSWRRIVERHGSALSEPVVTGNDAGTTASGASPDLDAPSLRFWITVAAPSRKVAARWGDWHLAHGLASALGRAGHGATMGAADRSDSLAARACDVHIVLRGLHRVRPTPGQRQVLWVISHPEDLSDDECDEADLVLVASERFAAELRTRTTTPVSVLLQATDPERFRPRPVDERHRHAVTIVAKSRDVLRPMVSDALAAGLRPAIYGSGWEGLVDADLVVSGYVANEELPAIYASAGVVLNDHWDTMRAWGFVSNRIFDVLATGTPVVSDHLPEVPELFGDLVPTWQSPEELGEIVARLLDDDAEARSRAAEGRRLVLGAHTFDHRAGELLAALAQHL